MPRDGLNERIESIVALTREVDESALDDLEMSLLASDIGVGTAAEIVDSLRARAKRHEIQNGDVLKTLLKQEIRSLLDAEEEQVFSLGRRNRPP